MKMILRDNVGWSQSYSSDGCSMSSSPTCSWSQCWDSDWSDCACWSESGNYSEQMADTVMIYPGASSCFGFNWN